MISDSVVLLDTSRLATSVFPLLTGWACVPAGTVASLVDVRPRCGSAALRTAMCTPGDLASFPRVFFKSHSVSYELLR